MRRLKKIIFLLLVALVALGLDAARVYAQQRWWNLIIIRGDEVEYWYSDVHFASDATYFYGSYWDEDVGEGYADAIIKVDHSGSVVWAKAFVSSYPVWHLASTGNYLYGSGRTFVNKIGKDGSPQWVDVFTAPQGSYPGVIEVEAEGNNVYGIVHGWWKYPISPWPNILVACPIIIAYNAQTDSIIALKRYLFMEDEDDAYIMWKTSFDVDGGYMYFTGYERDEEFLSLTRVNPSFTVSYSVRLDAMSTSRGTIGIGDVEILEAKNGKLLLYLAGGGYEGVALVDGGSLEVEWGILFENQYFWFEHAFMDDSGCYIVGQWWSEEWDEEIGDYIYVYDAVVVKIDKQTKTVSWAKSYMRKWKDIYSQLNVNPSPYQNALYVSGIAYALDDYDDVPFIQLVPRSGEYYCLTDMDKSAFTIYSISALSYQPLTVNVADAALSVTRSSGSVIAVRNILSSFTAEPICPISGQTTIRVTAPSTVSPNSPFSITVEATDPDGAGDIAAVTLEATGDLILEWDASSNQFTEVSDPNGYCTLLEDESSAEQVDDNTIKVVFTAALSGEYPYSSIDVTVTVTDQSGGRSSSTYQRLISFSGGGRKSAVAGGTALPHQPGIAVFAAIAVAASAYLLASRKAAGRRLQP